MTTSNAPACEAQPSAACPAPTVPASGVVVMKFGGTSVSSLNNWQNIAAQIQEHLSLGHRPFIVCSAIAGATNMLEKLITLAPNDEHRPLFLEYLNKHVGLARSLGLPPGLLAEEFTTLERLLTGLSLTGDLTPRLQARIIAQGELMSTRLGSAFLNSLGLSSQWLDARSILCSCPERSASRTNAYLNASCDPRQPLPQYAALRQQLCDAPAGQVFLTQGFIASNPQGETVLLGRGGSDVSGAYFAVIAQAQKLEIWTDVPGMYTADPHLIPSARLLRALDYTEAQELATLGAKVLHPRCLAPLQEARIPLEIRCTSRPQLQGTCISDRSRFKEAQVKALASRSKVILISMEDIGMWQEAGFLARAFGVLARHGLSVDLIATSQTNVTVSLDAGAHIIEQDKLDKALGELQEFCQPTLISPCTSISLVGSQIRSNLYRLGPVLELFEEEKIHLMSQASSDLNMTFVMEQEQVERLLPLLHSQLFSAGSDSRIFGSSWHEDFEITASSQSSAYGQRTLWWQNKTAQLLELAPHTPAYVYDRDTLRDCVGDLQGLGALDQVMFAIKANPNPEIIQYFLELGMGFECVSAGEVARVRSLCPQLDPAKIMFTPNFAAREDYQAGFEAGCHVTVDNAQVLDLWPELFRGRRIFLRLDLGHGAGHSSKVRTAGNHSKFGIPLPQLPQVVERLHELDITVEGLHSHSGSGIKTVDTWSRQAAGLAAIAEEFFPDVQVLDLGGGLGVPERPNAEFLDLSALNARLAEFKKLNPRFKIWIEPGRYPVAQAGILLTRVTQTKTKGDKHFVGVDAGMNNLIRPALYGAYHEIRNLSALIRPDGQENAPETEAVDVVGPICETGDVLGHDRRLPRTEPGDLLVICTAGAYGQAMSSDYNLHAKAQEFLI